MHPQKNTMDPKRKHFAKQLFRPQRKKIRELWRFPAFSFWGEYLLNPPPPQKKKKQKQKTLTP